jgi:D-arabinose 1-dehydrogenase-like Zn-dependent alcohol dehydrogenase
MVNEIKNYIGEFIIKVLIETVGFPTSIMTSLNLISDGGTVLLNGYSMEDIPLPPYLLVARELSLVGCRAATKRDVRSVITLIQEGKIKPAVTQKYSLDDINIAFDDLRNGKCLGRQVIIP